MKDRNYDDTNWRIDLDDVMKEYNQDRGGGIVVDSADTYRGLVMLGSAITDRAQSTIEKLTEYNNTMIEELFRGEHNND